MVGLQPDRSAVAAVTAVRTTLWNMGLTAERHRTRPTVAATDVEPAFVDELGHSASLLSAPSEPAELHGFEGHSGTDAVRLAAVHHVGGGNDRPLCLP